MISSLVICSAVSAGEIPVSNGYLLFQRLRKKFAECGDNNFLHDEAPWGGKLFSFSALSPLSFWRSFVRASDHASLRFPQGEMFAFRVSFLEDELFALFGNKMLNCRLRIEGAGFYVLSTSCPGDNEMSRAVSLEELSRIKPYQGAEMRFISPICFRSSGIQRLLPESAILFGSLAARWRSVFGEEVLDTVPRDIVVNQFALRSCAVQLKNGAVSRGCIGKISYDWRRLNEEEKHVLSCLASFSFYSGVGYKTSQGLGQVLPQLKNFVDV